MLCSLSNLESKDLAAIQEMEKELGKSLLAFSCHDARIAELEADKLTRLQLLENRLGLSLIAVES